MDTHRKHSVNRVEDVNPAVPEADGSISVLSDVYQYRLVRKRKSKQSTAQRLSS